MDTFHTETESRGRLPGETDERRAAGILQSAFHTGCTQLDCRVPIHGAAGFVVSYCTYSKLAERHLPSAETFLTYKDAMDFQALHGGHIAAVRADGSIIGEVPTPAQEREMRERAAASRREMDADMMMHGFNGRGR